MPIELSTEQPPDDITVDDFEALRTEILTNVSNGAADPLMGLSDHFEEQLIRLAYNDEFNLALLVRSVQDAIRNRGDGENQAKRFNLKPYLKKAKELRATIAEAQVRKEKLRARNMHLIDGGKPDRDVTKVQEASDDEAVQARMFSQSTFLKAVGTLEAAAKGRVWYDVFMQNYMTDWDGVDLDNVIKPQAVDDSFHLNLMAWLHTRDTDLSRGLSLDKTVQAMMHFADKDQRNEPRDWLTGLVWDNQPRIASWLSELYGVPDDQYHADVGRIWLVSMAARIMRPGVKVDTMPVLIGPQGNGKSTSLSILGGKWYATVNTSIDKQNDFLMTLSGLLLAEIAELDAISRAADSRVKSMLSTARDKFRPPYGRTTKEFDRTAVLVGSTNDKSWHKDNTGGRRYLPIDCSRPIKLDWLRANRDQLFAEALALYKGGADWWLIDEAEQRRRVMEHHVDDPWQERIEAWLQSKELWTDADNDVPKVWPDPTSNLDTGYWGTLVTTSRIAREALEMSTDRTNRVTSLKIATIMRDLGFEMRLVRESMERGKSATGRVMRAWVVTRDAMVNMARSEG